MIRIEKNKEAVLTACAIFPASLILCAFIIIDLARNGAEAGNIFLLIVGILSLIIGTKAVFLSFAEYKLTEAGITMSTLFHIRQFYPWEDYPYCYVIWLWDKKLGPYSNIVFSKTEIDFKRAKRMKNGYRPKPHSMIYLDHTQNRVDELRALRPELKIEYRNTYLAKGHYEKW